MCTDLPGLPGHRGPVAVAAAACVGVNGLLEISATS